MVDVAGVADITFGGRQGAPYLTELLISDVSKLLKDILNPGRYAGGVITVTAGVVTIPAGSVFMVDSGEGLLRVEFPIAFTTLTGVADTEEVYLNLALLTTGSLTVVLEAAAAAPVNALLLGVASGTPVDTFTEDFILNAGLGEGAGAVVPAIGVVVEESGNAGMQRTVLTLTNVSVPIVSVGAAAGFGGVKIYDLPEGMISFQGCMANLSMSVPTADQADYTDGTPEGDVGIGTVIIANGDALGTDATDDDFGTGTAFVMTAFVDASIPISTEAAANFDGTSTAVDINISVLVDAADIDDDVTTSVEISGTITFTWTNLGDV